MLFNSIEFTIFLPIVFAIYWLLNKSKLKTQNFFLLTASYVFYAWWDWRFLSLILFSSVVDYLIGIRLGKATINRDRKWLITISIFVNLGLLGLFKYFNFFTESFAQAFTVLASPIDLRRLNLILPVGISFYTFQTLSYSIDVYKRKLEPTLDFVSFMAFVSFFPQLVAGPIERASNLLPQFYKKRSFNYFQAVDGLRQILWGLVKKVVIADSCAGFVNIIFNTSDQQSGAILLLGAILFAFQIYGDFSGYSDIAIGTARLFGFNLMRNFKFPYFSRDIAEFWRRWHISLSSWFRDYLYIPLGGSKAGLGGKIRNTFIIFLLSGFWHGANWTFIIWGFLNALFFLPLLLSKNNRTNLNTIAEGNILPSIKETYQITSTFFLTVLAWIFFRADSLSHALSIINEIFSTSIINYSKFNWSIELAVTICFIMLFVLVEWVGREREYAIEKMWLSRPRFKRWGIYLILIFSILYSTGNQQQFIYFQF
tara:strand:+ start:771 stop:2219 length:1449 start_codon:yes stop_codon:yes gene_type:complete